MEERVVYYFYVASPHSHEDYGVIEARYHAVLEVIARIIECFSFSEVRPLVVPFSPIGNSFELDKILSMPNRKWYDFDLLLMKLFDVLCVLQLPGWEKSVGVRKEIDFAKEHNMPILYITQDNFIETIENYLDSLVICPKCPTS